MEKTRWAKRSRNEWSTLSACRGIAQTARHAGDQSIATFLPNGGMVMDSQENLYGTAESGGNIVHYDPVDIGAVFKVAPDGSESLLYSFDPFTKDGSGPEDGLLIDNQGNLYGTTAYARLYSMVEGKVEYNDYTYTEQ